MKMATYKGVHLEVVYQIIVEYYGCALLGTQMNPWVPKIHAYGWSEQDACQEGF